MAVYAREIMTSPVVSVKPETSLKEVAEILEEHAFSGIPVVDEENRVVGIISETDIIRYTQQVIGQPVRKPYKLLTQDKEVLHVNVLHRGVEMLELVAATTVEKLMSREVITVEESTSVQEVIELMNRHNINRVPVLDRKGNLSGMISRENVIKSLSRMWSRFTSD